ncbi:MAG: pantetheine-phosphate adenylyltransferase [Clostridia bacterium]|jgi:pantetheine-phosphate adenylyltransferase|nr:pantetheine-phosphate adenylyltransferase [Clostridia bacterium]
MKKCVFSGTFDPPTRGHKNVIETCLKIFDEVVVAVMVNPAKTPFFTTEQRLSLLGKLFKNQPRVKIRSFSGAAVDLLAEEDTVFYVRGLRNTVDFEYENADHFASKKLKNDIVTLYIPAEQDDLHISSSLVKNSVKFKKDYSNLIPEEIKEEFEKIINGVK